MFGDNDNISSFILANETSKYGSDEVADKF